MLHHAISLRGSRLKASIIVFHPSLQKMGTPPISSVQQLNRQFSDGGKKGSSSKPEWMIAAENEARAAQGTRSGAGLYQNGPSSVENTFMNSLKHDIGSESVSNTARLQAKFEEVVKKLKSMSTESSSQKIKFDRVRKTAIDLRNQLIIQREVAGFTTDNTSVIETAFPIPHRSIK